MTHALRRLAGLLAAALLVGAIAAPPPQPARAQPSRHLALGNPSGATADPAQPANYLIDRPQYALAYQRDAAIARWVAWNLVAADFPPESTVERFSGNFIPDPALQPLGWYQAAHDDYTNSGYDRGHMAPSADRLASEDDQVATFYMANILPQAPDNNRQTWRLLEEHTRSRVRAGNEAYVFSGPLGSQGALAGDRISIPAELWKVVVILPPGDNDAARVSAQTEVIAVITPNANGISSDWASFSTSIACIEQRSGLDLLSAVDPAVQAALAGAPCLTGDSQVYLPLVAAAAGAPPPAVTITAIEYDPPGIDARPDIPGEYVLIANSGGGPADMTGWALRDAAGATFTFPSFTLAAGAEVRVYSGGQPANNDSASLYWGRSQGVWNNSGGDTATLRDIDNNVVASYSYP